MVFDRSEAVQTELRPGPGNADASDTVSDRDGAGDSSRKVFANIDNGDCSVVGDTDVARRAVACSQCCAIETADIFGRQTDVDGKRGKIRGGRSFVVFLTAVSFTGGAHGNELCFSASLCIDDNEALLGT